jgi:hypothetical protein
MRTLRIPTTMRTLAVAATIAVIFVLLGIESGRLDEYSRLYNRKADMYRYLETSLTATKAQWEAMEESSREAAARFRRGEWGQKDEKYKKEFNELIGTMKGTESDAVIKQVEKKFYDSMAKTCEDSAASSHKVAVSYRDKANYFSQLKTKYERAAKAPWWPVPSDPPEPK